MVSPAPRTTKSRFLDASDGFEMRNTSKPARWLNRDFKSLNTRLGKHLISDF